MPGDPRFGSNIATMLAARLSVDGSFNLVERAALGKALNEQQLSLSGLADPATAAKVGDLVGAKILITGKAFMMDNHLILTAKVIGVETSRVVGQMRQIDTSKELAPEVFQFADELAKLIRDRSAELLPAGQVMPDPVAQIRQQLGDSPRPTVAVIIPEQHRARRPAAPPVDPAVETEIKNVLGACGFTIVDVGRNDLADWARQMRAASKDVPWPAALDQVDVVIVGEAMSEFAGQTDDLISCAARAEINVIDRHTGRIILADRQTQRAVDVAENIAGKTALQKAGRQLGLSASQSLVGYAATPSTQP